MDDSKRKEKEKEKGKEMRRQGCSISVKCFVEYRSTDI
jgi:hypothetical protein